MNSPMMSALKPLDFPALTLLGLLLSALLYSPLLLAGKADVLDVRVKCDGLCRFSVTVQHADSGWDHYADAWQVLTTDGRVLATRTLLHPHVDEQPFTRSLGGVEIPADIHTVVLRAHDKVHGYGGVEKRVDIPRR